LVLGILAVPGSLIPVLGLAAAPLGLLAVIFGIIAAVKASKQGESKGLAITGLILGAVSLVISIVITIITAAAVNQAVNELNPGLSELDKTMDEIAEEMSEEADDWSDAADDGDELFPESKATYTAVPDPALAEGREWTGELSTSVGVLGISLDGAAAPQATANFLQLARDGYYDTSSCHRLTTDGIFVLQCGSLTGDGGDSPGYQFGPVENAPESGVYPAGTIAMARAASEDSQGAQFFIVYKESTIPGGYSVFGHVTSGLEAIEQIAADGTADGGSDGQPATPVTIERIKLQ
jgi:peptidyl-prolyl cis-trans isomerase B (cyclophilin B)